MSEEQFKQGDYVIYRKPFDNLDPQLGRIKFIAEGGAFVVYHCDKNWDNYLDYTGVLTSYDCLTLVPKASEQFENFYY